MARCNCGESKCSCVIVAGEGAAVTGNGRPDKPYVVSLAGGGGGGGGSSQWDAGDLKWSARAAAPPGWLVADGSSVSRTTYAALFAAIGTAFGDGDGVSTFSLPDYTGKFMMGSDNAHPRGSVGGSASQELDINNIPRHTHAIDHDHAQFNSAAGGGHNHPAFDSGNGGNHAHELRFSDDPGNDTTRVPKGDAGAGDTDDAAVVVNGQHNHTINVPSVADHVHAVNVPPFAGASGTAGQLDPTPVPIIPPYTTALPLIKT